MIGLGIPPRPENFSVWYAHVSGAVPDLSRRIDDLLAAGQPFDDERNRELYALFVGVDRQEEALTATNRRLQEAIEIGRASCREKCVSTCRSRGSPYH